MEIKKRTTASMVAKAVTTTSSTTHIARTIWGGGGNGAASSSRIGPSNTKKKAISKAVLGISKDKGFRIPQIRRIRMEKENSVNLSLECADEETFENDRYIKQFNSRRMGLEYLSLDALQKLPDYSGYISLR
jgi:hypothetical protein